MSRRGLPPPPARLRFMKEDDARFLRIATKHVELLERFGFNAGSSILDIGSGYGKLAYGILDRFDFHGRYVGLDILPAHVRWCQENISSQLPQFRFERIDVYNDRYNPQGSNIAAGFRFQLPEASFEFCVLFSVFTHMYGPDIQSYLAEVSRLLQPDGIGIATFFLFDEERLRNLETHSGGLTMQYALNEYTRYHNPQDKLHAIAFDRDWTRRMIQTSGFEVLEMSDGHWAGATSANYQDYVVFCKIPDRHVGSREER